MLVELLDLGLDDVGAVAAVDVAHAEAVLGEEHLVVLGQLVGQPVEGDVEVVVLLGGLDGALLLADAGLAGDDHLAGGGLVVVVVAHDVVGVAVVVV